MSTLLTGGAGFVGLNVAEALLRQGREVVLLGDRALPASIRSRLEKLAGTLSVVQADVADSGSMRQVFAKFHPDRVIHAAAITPGEEREAREFGRIVDVNIKGTGNVVQGAVEAGVRRVIFVSSGSAYGEALHGASPLVEDVSLPVPDTLYAITKHAGEGICRRIARTRGASVICVRLGSVFGPWERDTGVRDTFSVPLQILRLAMSGEEIRLAPQEPRRDWIYSRDVAAGLTRILDAAALQHDLYNLSAGGAWQNFYAAWCNHLRTVFPGMKFRIIAPGERPNVAFLGERDRASMSVERLTADTGFRPDFDQATAFADYAAWIRDNPGFFRDAGRVDEDRT